LIIEEVKGSPAEAPNQFKGQSSPAGIWYDHCSSRYRDKGSR